MPSIDHILSRIGSYLTSIKATFRIDRDVALHLVPIVKRLAPGDYEAWVRLNVIRPFFLGERPITEIFRGDRVTINIEGPEYVCGGFNFPLGGLIIADQTGWLDIDPVETSELLKCLRKAIDEAAFRWLGENGKLDQPTSPHNQRNRPVDDEIARQQMVAAVISILQKGGPDHA